MTHQSQSAFPCSEDQTQGLNKREYFAAQALKGLLSNDGWSERIINEPPGDKALITTLTRAAVIAAESLIRELNKSL